MIDDGFEKRANIHIEAVHARGERGALRMSLGCRDSFCEDGTFALSMATPMAMSMAIHLVENLERSTDSHTAVDTLDLATRAGCSVETPTASGGRRL